MSREGWMTAVAEEYIVITTEVQGRKKAEVTMRERLAALIEKHSPPDRDAVLDALEGLYHWCPPLEGHPERAAYEQDLDRATELILKRANGAAQGF